MSEDSTGSLGKVIQIDESQIQAQLTRVVRGTVEETLNGLLDAEAERLVNAGRYDSATILAQNDLAVVFIWSGTELREQRLLC